MLLVWGLCRLGDPSLWDFIFGAIIVGLIAYALFPDKFQPLRDEIASGDINWHSPILLGGLLYLMILVFWFQWPVLGSVDPDGEFRRGRPFDIRVLAPYRLVTAHNPAAGRRPARGPAFLRLLCVVRLRLRHGRLLAVQRIHGLPALGVILAAISARRPDLTRPPYRGCAIAVVATILFATVFQKVNTPFFWGGWTEPPPWSSTTRSKLPQLDGFILSKHTADFYRRGHRPHPQTFAAG